MYIATNGFGDSCYVGETLQEVYEEMKDCGEDASSISQYSFFQGKSVKVKVIPEQISVVVEKKAVVKKPAAKKTGAKR